MLKLKDETIIEFSEKIKKLYLKCPCCGGVDFGITTEIIFSTYGDKAKEGWAKYRLDHSAYGASIQLICDTCGYIRFFSLKPYFIPHSLSYEAFFENMCENIFNDD